MELNAVEIGHKRFKTRWRGLDPQEVEVFCQGLLEEIQRLKGDNAELRRDLQEALRDLKDHKDREKAIRSVLVNAQKMAEGIKENAGKEAELIVADAELKAEKILQSAHGRLAQLQSEITELKRYRLQLQTKLRATIESYRQFLDFDREDDRESEAENKIKVLNRSS